MGAPLLLISLFLAFPWQAHSVSSIGPRAFRDLSTDAISALVNHPDPVRNVDSSNPNSHLSKILIPRPPDTANNTLVKDYLVSTMKKLNWHVEEDSFTDSTPYGEKRFTNVIATKDPAALRRVVVAAHFDSKFFSTSPADQFVGATDSAAPCAFMLDLAETLDPLLNQRKERLEAGEEDDEDIADTTLQLIFFDGEEAYKDWTATDSLYGSRHLAKKWSSSYIAPHTKRRMLPYPSTTEISTIEHFILLDLLGAPKPTIRSSFRETGWLFDAMVSVERRLAEHGAFTYDGDKATTKDSWTSFFMTRTGMEFGGGIEDDHIPFYRLGVDILHIIANPFPRVWHRLEDDATALDIPTMRRWNLILRVLMSEYLGLRPNDGSHSSRTSDSYVERDTTELVSEPNSPVSLVHSFALVEPFKTRGPMTETLGYFMHSGTDIISSIVFCISTAVFTPSFVFPRLW
ncbi:hypothetical protein BXZ70DRAFT_884538 [Cristinia sonorae]|uniref:Peptide hydrolase n=1 Tax=Cristinia sonorae TaxID=1940300 RepID=A0A8K0V0G0_9AGAR|nr:hypothetical protein BXZ70DRAFT_884538 [Cristinia sonorae]